MNQKTLLIVLIVMALIGAGSVASSMGLIGRANAEVVRDNLGVIDTVSVESYPETGIEIKNGTAGGTFVVPPSNAYTEITTWSSVADTKGLYIFTCNNDKIKAAKGTVSDITNAQGKSNGSVEGYSPLSSTEFEVGNLSHKYTGIAPIFDKNNEKVLTEVYLSLFSLRGTILETFITEGETTIATSYGAVNLNSGVSLESLTKSIFGTANEKQTLASGENWGIMRLSSVSTDVMNKIAGSKISNKFSKYKVYTVTMSNSQTVKTIVAQALINPTAQYSTLGQGEKEIVDLLADGILNYGTGDIIIIPVKDNAIVTSNGVALLSSKSPIDRSNN